MTHPQPATRIDRAEVFRLLRQGQSQVQIANAFGCTQGTISHIVCAHRSNRSLSTRISGVTAGGGLLKMLRGMPADQAHWLLDQVPEGGTLIETIRAIIIDAWAEDVQNKEATA